MWSLANRKWFVVALILFVGANAAQFLAKSHISRGNMAMRRAWAMARASGVAMNPSWRPEIVRWHDRVVHLWDVIGLGLAALALGFWLISWIRREDRPEGALPALFFFYLISFLILV